MKKAKSQRKKALLVSSCGGHWVQMNRVTSAFKQYEMHYVSTERDYVEAVKDAHFYYVPDASHHSSKLRILCLALKTLIVVAKVRPNVVLSTGAAPGFFALFFGKLIGAKTIWLDSIANVDKISLAGRKAQKYADLFLTQWEHLADQNTAEYHGSVV